MDKNFILNSLNLAANNNLWFNFVLHLVVVATVICISIPVIKNKRIIFDTTIFILLISVSFNAIISGNPFNSLTFGVGAIFALAAIFRNKREIPAFKKSPQIFVYLLFVFFGLWYPEFTETNIFASLLFSPAGIIPCPTLIIVLALFNIYYPKVSKSSYAAVIILGLFYSVVGVFILKVNLDIPLLLLSIYSAYNFSVEMFSQPERKHAKYEL